MKMNLFVLLLTITISSSLQAQDTLFVTREYIPDTDTILVFIPQNYDTNNVYPLVFMLHGWQGNFNQWNEIINLQLAADTNQFIIVCPDGFYDSWYINSPILNNSKWENFFFDDLVPSVFNNYKIDYSNIFITGLSMGGHGSILLFLKNPFFFKSAASTSGILDLTRFQDKWGLKIILGDFDSNKNNWFANSSLYNLNKIKWTKRPLLIDCGTEDFALDVNKKFEALCKIYDIDIKALFNPGKHEWKYWAKSIAEHFRFFKSLLKQNINR